MGVVLKGLRLQIRDKTIEIIRAPEKRDKTIQVLMAKTIEVLRLQIIQKKQ